MRLFVPSIRMKPRPLVSPTELKLLVYNLCVVRKKSVFHTAPTLCMYADSCMKQNIVIRDIAGKDSHIYLDREIVHSVCMCM